MVVLVGPAGCGKSTFAANHFRPTQIISSDHCRALVSDDERDQRFQAQAFALLDFIIEQRLGINRLCVVDSTAVTPPARQSLLRLARRHRVPCVAVLLDVSLEKCLAHDQSRERSVGRDAIERQFQLFQQAKSAIAQEGFDQVIVLREEDLGQVQVEVMFRPVVRAGHRTEMRRPARAVQPSAARPGTEQRGSGVPAGATKPAQPAGPAPGGAKPPDAPRT